MLRVNEVHITLKNTRRKAQKLSSFFNGECVMTFETSLFSQLNKYEDLENLINELQTLKRNGWDLIKVNIEDNLVKFTLDEYNDYSH